MNSDLNDDRARDLFAREPGEMASSDTLDRLAGTAIRRGGAARRRRSLAVGTASVLAVASIGAGAWALSGSSEEPGNGGLDVAGSPTMAPASVAPATGRPAGVQETEAPSSDTPPTGSDQSGSPATGAIEDDVLDTSLDRDVPVRVTSTRVTCEFYPVDDKGLCESDAGGLASVNWRAAADRDLWLGAEGKGGGVVAAWVRLLGQRVPINQSVDVFTATSPAGPEYFITVQGEDPETVRRIARALAWNS